MGSPRYIPPNNKQNEPTQGDIGETSNEPTQAKRNEFEELYASANEELYPSCDYATRLDFMEKFTYLKVKGKLTDSIFNKMLEFFQHVFPTMKGYKLPPSYYAIKKTFKMIGLGYESIHACVNDCFLFRGDNNKDVHFCPVYKTSRWKDNNTPGKKVPKKVLRYFSIIPRLQRLYKSSHTAKEMTWHATGKCTEPGLFADGFNPFGNLSQAYSMWPVILTTYNLPPWLCMKESSFMLTLLIPGPKSSGKDINVYLRPLIDDLKVLWALKGVETIDQYLPDEVAKPTIELCSFFKQICSATLMEDDMFKAQSKVFRSLCKSIGLLSVIRFDAQELKKVIWYVLHNSPEIDTYRSQFKSKFHNKDMKEEFPDWFGSQIRQHHIDNDPGVSTTSDLFALACGPTSTPISVNYCVVNGVRFVMHSRDERYTTQNSGICSPGGKDREIYYDGGVIVVEEDPDVIHFDNSSNLPLFTSLNDLDNVTLHIDGQSTEVDAPPDIIDLDEDDDIIDDEDALPHDLANSDDEDLVNVDDDDGVDVMSADVARGHGGDGGDDDRPPTHRIPTGYGGCFANRGKCTWKPNLGGRKAGRLHTRQETRNLGLKKITDDKGPVPIRFEWDDKKTMMPLDDHASHWSNYLGKLISLLGKRFCRSARSTQNRQNQAKSTVVCRQGSRSLARLRDQMEFGGASGSGGCGDDELGGDEDGDEVEEDGDS
ncbi:reverse transcriptase domain-containing protein [Tanacetum coccineum]